MCRTGLALPGAAVPEPNRHVLVPFGAEQG